MGAGLHTEESPGTIRPPRETAVCSPFHSWLQAACSTARTVADPKGARVMERRVHREPEHYVKVGFCKDPSALRVGGWLCTCIPVVGIRGRVCCFDRSGRRGLGARLWGPAVGEGWYHRGADCVSVALPNQNGGKVSPFDSIDISGALGDWKSATLYCLRLESRRNRSRKSILQRDLFRG